MTRCHDEMFEGWSDTDSKSSVDFLEPSHMKKRVRSHSEHISYKKRRLEESNIVKDEETLRKPLQLENMELSAQMRKMKVAQLKLQRETGRHIICLVTSILAAEVLDTITLNYAHSILRIRNQLKARVKIVKPHDKPTSEFLQGCCDELVSCVEQANNRRMAALMEMEAAPYFRNLVFEHGPHDENHQFNTKKATANLRLRAHEASVADPEDFSVLIDWFQNYMRRNFQTPPSA